MMEKLRTTEKMPTFAVIIAAAGKSVRFCGATKKIFCRIVDKPVWQYSAELFASHPLVRQLIIVIAPEDRDSFQRDCLQGDRFPLELVDGGTERFESIENGLKVVQENIDFVAIHDAARPCLRREQIDRVFQIAIQSGAAILAAPVVATLKRGNDHQQIVETVPRQDLWEAQTPQVFRRDWIVEGFAKRTEDDITDDAQLLEKINHPVSIVSSDQSNIKITTQNDLYLTELWLKIRETIVEK